jgi:hypothetical protein
MPYTKSTFRYYADLWVKRVGDEPVDGLTQTEWDQMCLDEAERYGSKAEEHEKAISQGYEAEQRFWAGLSGELVP